MELISSGQNSYFIEEQIGQGSFSRVFLARTVEDEGVCSTPVALKRIKKTKVPLEAVRNEVAAGVLLTEVREIVLIYSDPMR